MQASRGDSILSGRYLLERELARGGMGALWVASDVRLKRKVAIKLIGAAALPTEELRIRFEREAVAVARLQSPYVVQIHDYGFDHGIAYIVMELLEGEDLRTRLNRVPWLPLADVRKLVEQVGKALEHIHAAGIVHRDLKPANIFLAKMGNDEQVKVIDFGVVRTGEDKGRRLTMAAYVLGTPRYMSPEQLRGLETIDGRSDLWALAVIAYRSLTGRLPYPGESPAELFKSMQRGALMPASRLAPELPGSVDLFFSKALALTLGERYATAAEMVTAFSHIGRAIGKQTLQFGTNRGMLISRPDEVAAPPTPAPSTAPSVSSVPSPSTIPVVYSGPITGTIPMIQRDPASEVTVRKERAAPPAPEPPQQVSQAWPSVEIPIYEGTMASPIAGTPGAPPVRQAMASSSGISRAIESAPATRPPRRWGLLILCVVVVLAVAGGAAALWMFTNVGR